MKNNVIRRVKRPRKTQGARDVSGSLERTLWRTVLTTAGCDAILDVHKPTRGLYGAAWHAAWSTSKYCNWICEAAGIDGSAVRAAFKAIHQEAYSQGASYKGAYTLEQAREKFDELIKLKKSNII